ncbi:MAG TPA: F0F1 ATP synthase subunit B [Vicinamibacteria bacterium]|nr:F0F1 ATP synthase subunit B [Vicinamibacteria bacterium]
MVSLVPAALAAGGFTDLEFGLTLWTVVLFAIFAFVLTKLGWKPLLAMIEEREKGIHDAVGSAQKANEEAHRLLAQHQELIREAGRQREEIMKRALADAETVKTDVIAQARAESDRMVQKAKEQIEREKKLAIQELRSSVADLAVEAAAKIVQSSLTPEAQKKLVHDFIDNLPQARG